MKITFAVGLLVVSSVASIGCTQKIKIGPGSILEAGTSNQIRERIQTKHPQLRAADLLATDQGEGELRQEYAQILTECSKVLSRFEGQSEVLQWLRVGMAVVGSVAGSVGVPALTAAAPLANKTAIAALGGLSGVTNAGQSALTDAGLTPAEALMTREGIRTDWRTAINKYFAAMAATPKNLPAAAAALDEAKVACTLYAINIQAAVPTKSN